MCIRDRLDTHQPTVKSMPEEVECLISTFAVQLDAGYGNEADHAKPPNGLIQNKPSTRRYVQQPVEITQAKTEETARILKSGSSACLLYTSDAADDLTRV